MMSHFLDDLLQWIEGKNYVCSKVCLFKITKNCVKVYKKVVNTNGIAHLLLKYFAGGIPGKQYFA